MEESKEIQKLKCPAQLRHYTKRTLCGKDLTYSEELPEEISFECPDKHHFDKRSHEFKKLKAAHERLVKFRTYYISNAATDTLDMVEPPVVVLERSLPLAEPPVLMTDVERSISTLPVAEILPVAEMLPLRPNAQEKSGGKRNKTKRKHKRKHKTKRKRKKRKTKRKRKKQQ